MRKTRFASIVLALVLAGWACGRSSPTPNTLPTAPPTDAAIGTVTRIETILRQGPDEDSLSPISGTNSLNDGDFLQVTDGGKGVLDFGDAIRITIFNDTNLGNIRTEAEPGASLKIRLLLQKGGFLGTVDPSEGVASIDTPNNGQINVVGTTFFVLFDETTGATIVGNFDGIVDVASGGVQVGLTPGFYLEFAGGPPGPEIPIPFTPRDFENQADSLDSPIAGFASLTGQPDDIPTDQAKRIDPAELANYFIEIGACTAQTVSDGSEAADVDIAIFWGTFLEGGCEIFYGWVLPPEPDAPTMQETLDAIADLGVPSILYFPIDQPTADLLLEVIREHGGFKGAWLVDAEGIKQEGSAIIE